MNIFSLFLKQFLYWSRLDDKQHTNILGEEEPPVDEPVQGEDEREVEHPVPAGVLRSDQRNINRHSCLFSVLQLVRNYLIYEEQLIWSKTSFYCRCISIYEHKFSCYF